MSTGATGTSTSVETRVTQASKRTTGDMMTLMSQSRGQQTFLPSTAPIMKPARREPVIVRATSAAGNSTGTGGHRDGTRTDASGGASTVALSSPIGSHASYPAYSASVYHETIKARAAWHHGRGGRTSGGMVSRLTPWDGRTGTYLWDWFPPAFNCPFRERLGRWADGGKIICNWQALDHRDCVVFSFRRWWGAHVRGGPCRPDAMQDPGLRPDGRGDPLGHRLHALRRSGRLHRFQT